MEYVTAPLISRRVDLPFGLTTVQTNGLLSTFENDLYSHNFSHAKGLCVDRSKGAKFAFGDKTVILFQKDGKEFMVIDEQCRLIFL